MKIATPFSFLMECIFRQEATAKSTLEKLSTPGAPAGDVGTAAPPPHICLGDFNVSALNAHSEAWGVEFGFWHLNVPQEPAIIAGPSLDKLPFVLGQGVPSTFLAYDGGGEARGEDARGVRLSSKFTAPRCD